MCYLIKQRACLQTIQNLCLAQHITLIEQKRICALQWSSNVIVYRKNTHTRKYVCVKLFEYLFPLGIYEFKTG